MTMFRKLRQTSVGAPIDRVDGRLKVTGGARYAAEYAIPNLAHAVMITSTVAKGTIRAMDTSAAARAPGVIKVLTPFNAPKLPGAPKPGPKAQSVERGAQGAGAGGSAQGAQASARAAVAMRVPTLLQDDVVRYNGQPIGVVVADTWEHAREAADLVRVTYDAERPVLDWTRAATIPQTRYTR